MPMIDVYSPEALLGSGSERTLGERLTQAVLRAEGVSQPSAFHQQNTAAFLHPLPTVCVQTGADSCAHAIRVQVLTPPHALTRDGQRQLVKEITDAVQAVCSEGNSVPTVWVLLTEAAEGGRGIGGTAFGQEEFSALARRALHNKCRFKVQRVGLRSCWEPRAITKTTPTFREEDEQ